MIGPKAGKVAVDAISFDTPNRDNQDNMSSRRNTKQLLVVDPDYSRDSSETMWVVL